MLNFLIELLVLRILPVVLCHHCNPLTRGGLQDSRYQKQISFMQTATESQNMGKVVMWMACYLLVVKCMHISVMVHKSDCFKSQICLWLWLIYSNLCKGNLVICLHRDYPWTLQGLECSALNGGSQELAALKLMVRFLWGELARLWPHSFLHCYLWIFVSWSFLCNLIDKLLADAVIQGTMHSDNDVGVWRSISIYVMRESLHAAHNCKKSCFCASSDIAMNLSMCCAQIRCYPWCETLFC